MPEEIHATLGKGVNESRTGENESISAPSMGPLTQHQCPMRTHTREESTLHLHTPAQEYSEHVQGAPLA